MKSRAVISFALCVIGVPCLIAQDGGKKKATEDKKRAQDQPKKEDKNAEKGAEPADSPFKIFPAPDGRSYFPRGREGWYTEYLSVMKEPSLQAEGKETEGWSLRFTWLRTFDAPIAVRLWKDGEDIQMRAVRLSGKGGYDPGKIDKEITRKLTVDERKKVQPLIESKELWEPLTNDEDALTMGGSDGAQWIFERRIKSTYAMQDIPNAGSLAAMKAEEIKKLGLDPAKVRDFAKIAEAGLFLAKLAELLPAAGKIY